MAGSAPPPPRARARLLSALPPFDGETLLSSTCSCLTAMLFVESRWWLRNPSCRLRGLSGGCRKPRRKSSSSARVRACDEADDRRHRSRPSRCSAAAWSAAACVARARHAEAVRSGRRQHRRVSSVLGHRAGRGDRVGSVWTRARAVRGGAFPCASRPSHGTLARARPCERVRSMWPALGEGEPSRGVTVGC